MMAHSETITLGNGEWDPYQSSTMDGFGYASKIVTEAFKKEGIDVKYNFYPWARALDSASKGKVAGTFLWGYKKEREKHFLYSEPILDVSYVFFYLAERKFDWKKIDDLKDKRIGTTIKYSYGEAFDKARAKGIFEADDSNSDETNFKKLLAGRVDIIPNDLDAGLSILRRNHKDEIKRVSYHEKPVRNTPHYLLISRKHPRAEYLLAAFNKGLAALKKSGRYQEIIKASRNLKE
ncbi:amino acid ABC transporter substrate-binding protein, PAAT family [Pseudobacteriovorax antillogorgiicola]|uniref:Amino acid ABC transporter substrate-binding protein, PAAT family n=2 Tax=Pseudobacteriovorax antillogorgiicola TaxID=1513793 RepID=A0A1Y6CBD5_9BACT|nr:amino acid ABC transporter substrate-binding protein (PAAT family) [Pseudobacteriovorax antillogorgiicola]SMF54540.1 amino acid ABC transporter substrate-binding protein, PAAT family [Pseudobacteriovorax antillogorgiicola]